MDDNTVPTAKEDGGGWVKRRETSKTVLSEKNDICYLGRSTKNANGYMFEK